MEGGWRAWCWVTESTVRTAWWAIGARDMQYGQIWQQQAVAAQTATASVMICSEGDDVGAVCPMRVPARQGTTYAVAHLDAGGVCQMRACRLGREKAFHEPQVSNICNPHSYVSVGHRVDLRELIFWSLCALSLKQA